MFKTSKVYENQIVSICDIHEKFGKYQILQFFYICYPVLLVAIININYIFVVEDVRYRCRVSECDSLNSNYTVPWWPNHTDQCTKPILNQTYLDVGVCSNSSFTGNTEKCTDWIYENHDTVVSEIKLPPNELTRYRLIVKLYAVKVEDKFLYRVFWKNSKLQFNLACQPWKKNVVGSVHSIGMAFAMFMGGWMSDSFGRKLTLIICTLSCIIGNFKTFAMNYYLYITLEFLEAAISGGVYTAASVLMVEIAGKKSRILAGVLFCYAVYAGEGVLALIGMALSSWKTIIYTIYSPSIFFLSFIILGYESPRWLIVTGKVNKAKKTLKEMARMNNVNINEEELKTIDEEKLKSIFNIDESLEKEGIAQSFQCKELVIRVLVASFCRFTCGFIYYGLLVLSPMIPGDKNINFLLVTISSFPGDLISMILMNKIGRKLPLMIEFLLCGMACVAFGYVTEKWYKIFFLLLAKFITSACYTSLMAYTVELFPTSVRGSLIGLCTLSSALGNMLAPLIPALSLSIVTPIFGCAAVLSCIFLIFTPETKNSPLFDTIKQVADNIQKSKKKKHNNEEDNCDNV